MFSGNIMLDFSKWAHCKNDEKVTKLPKKLQNKQTIKFKIRQKKNEDIKKTIKHEDNN
jgi:hypothetical protein